MKQKLRLVLGRPLDAPFANSVPTLMLLAILLIAGSGLLWSEASDTLFLSRENAKAVSTSLVSCTLTGQDSYVPRLEISADDGNQYVLMQSQAGDVLEAVAEQLKAGEAIELRLSRKGRVLEVQQGESVLLHFEHAKRASRVDVLVSALTACVFDLLGILLLIRSVALGMNRKRALGGLRRGGKF